MAPDLGDLCLKPSSLGENIRGLKKKRTKGSCEKEWKELMSKISDRIERNNHEILLVRMTLSPSGRLDGLAPAVRPRHQGSGGAAG